MVSRKPKSGRDVEICSVCKTVIRSTRIFCEVCGPPQLPPEEVPGGINFGQTFIRVFMLVAVFSGLVIFKTQPDTFSSVDALVTKIKSELPILQEEIPPADEPDFKLVHKVNVAQANVRTEASANSPVLEVLHKGQVVKMIRKVNAWSQIQLGKKKGWIATRLLDSTVE